MQKRSSMFLMSFLTLIVIGAGVPASHASSIHDELDSCVAGNAIDLPCMKKHRSRFEKYVIKDRDSIRLKRIVAQDLVVYYERSGEPTTPDSRVVKAKYLALKRAEEIELEVFSSHHHACTKGPDCEDGYYMDTGYAEYRREQRIRVKQYLVGLDPSLYEPEIKYVELDIAGKGHGPGFWNQVGTGLLQGAADAVSK